MSNEWSGSSTTGNGLKDGRIDLDIATLVKEITHRREDLRTLEEDLLHMAIDSKVYVALAEA